MAVLLQLHTRHRLPTAILRYWVKSITDHSNPPAPASSPGLAALCISKFARPSQSVSRIRARGMRMSVVKMVDVSRLPDIAILSNLLRRVPPTFASDSQARLCWAKSLSLLHQSRLCTLHTKRSNMWSGRSANRRRFLLLTFEFSETDIGFPRAANEWELGRRRRISHQVLARLQVSSRFSMSCAHSPIFLSSVADNESLSSRVSSFCLSLITFTITLILFAYNQKFYEDGVNLAAWCSYLLSRRVKSFRASQQFITPHRPADSCLLRR